MQNLPRKNYLGDLNDLTLNQLVVGSNPPRGTSLFYLVIVGFPSYLRRQSVWRFLKSHSACNGSFGNPWE